MGTIPPPAAADALHLPPPRLHGALTLVGALKKRRSSRDFLPDPLPLDQISALLWAGLGVNRPGSWGRTAPSIHESRQILVYAVLPECTYRYDAREHRLLPVRVADLRAATGTQDFVATAPLNLVYVIDGNRGEPEDEEEHGLLAGADVGCIVENIYLYCAGAGLATVARGQLDRRQLAQALGLPPTQRIALAQTVGFARPTSH